MSKFIIVALTILQPIHKQRANKTTQKKTDPYNTMYLYKVQSFAIYIIRFAAARS